MNHPQNIRELLFDLEFAVRQHIQTMPPRVIEAIDRIDEKRAGKRYHHVSGADDVDAVPLSVATSPPNDLFSTNENEIKW